VLIEELTPAAKELGITKELLKTDVELKLRFAGIRVYNREEEMFKNPVKISSLYINLNVISGTAGGVNIYPYHIYIALKDEVYIKRISTLLLSLLNHIV